MTLLQLSTEDVKGFFNVLHMLNLGLGPVIEANTKAIQDLQHAMEIRMSGVESELVQTRQAFDTLKTAVSGRLQQLQDQLAVALSNHSDTLSPEAQVEFDGIQTDMESLTNSLNGVTPQNPAVPPASTGTVTTNTDDSGTTTATEGPALSADQG